MDTIFSLSTAYGKAGISVIRVSGKAAADSCKKIAGFKPCIGQPALRRLKDQNGELIDRALILFFEAGASFTGETVVEYHLHGSIAVISKLLGELNLQTNHREAMPGEFTRRALENNRLDITQIEGLADLINSETEAQRKQAVRVFDGSIGRKVKEWRASLIEAGSLIEVTIDFSEEDIPLGLLKRVSELVTKIIMELEKEIESTKLSERVRSGFEVAIIGAPNVGKSTLINALAGREAAITSKIAGTTRDVIEVRMDLNGLPVTFLDTAGLRETKNEVEILGIKRARDRAETADLRIFLTEEKPLKEFIVKQELDIEIASKGDLSGVGVSGLTGYGIPELIDLVSEKLTKMALGAGIATNERHRRAMIISVGTLKNCKKELQRDVVRSEIAAEELRSSVMALESMVGSVGVEDLLDEIFSNFCLGK